VTICDNNALTSEKAESLIDSIMNQTYGIDTYFFNLFYWEAYNAMYNVTYLTKMYAKAKLTDEEKMSLGLNLNLNFYSILQVAASTSNGAIMILIRSVGLIGFIVLTMAIAFNLIRVKM